MNTTRKIWRGLSLLLAALTLAALVGCSSNFAPTFPAPPAGLTPDAMATPAAH